MSVSVRKLKRSEYRRESAQLGEIPAIKAATDARADRKPTSARAVRPSLVQRTTANCGLLQVCMGKPTKRRSSLASIVTEPSVADSENELNDEQASPGRPEKSSSTGQSQYIHRLRFPKLGPLDPYRVPPFPHYRQHYTTAEEECDSQPHRSYRVPAPMPWSESSRDVEYPRPPMNAGEGEYIHDHGRTRVRIEAEEEKRAAKEHAGSYKGGRRASYRPRALVSRQASTKAAEATNAAFVEGDKGLGGPDVIRLPEQQHAPPTDPRRRPATVAEPEEQTAVIKVPLINSVRTAEPSAESVSSRQLAGLSMKYAADHETTASRNPDKWTGGLLVSSTELDSDPPLQEVQHMLGDLIPLRLTEPRQQSSDTEQSQEGQRVYGARGIEMQATDVIGLKDMPKFIRGMVDVGEPAGVRVDVDVGLRGIILHIDLRMNF